MSLVWKELYQTDRDFTDSLLTRRPDDLSEDEGLAVRLRLERLRPLNDGRRSRSPIAT